jgi:SpoVK/Ycf46/Vps4 family AAA+-type ATPase
LEGPPIPRNAVTALKDICSAYTRGKGMLILFSGSSGTDKTMAAESISNELEMELYRIDLSAVVSKYIGETEKNFSKLFDSAELSDAILVFDEADALFGKRSEVRDSHDRYANIDTELLLDRIEKHEGIVILTTNRKGDIDDVFLQRVHHIVEFPGPDQSS